MQIVTALFLTAFGLASSGASAQDSVQDWSKKVIELQEKEGQNFEQDLQLVKGYLYLQRRAEALTQLNRLIKTHGKKDQRLNELYETASDQFFFQETAELYADLLEAIKQENWSEAKDKAEQGLQKEPKHRLLSLRAIQLGIILNQQALLLEGSKNAELFFSDSPVWKIYDAWIRLSKADSKEIYRTLQSWWSSDRKFFENAEVPMLVFLQSLDQTKHSVEWSLVSKVIQKHPEWVGLRFWMLKSKNTPASERKKEINGLKALFQDMKKLKELREKGERATGNQFLGLISIDQTKAEFEELVK